VGRIKDNDEEKVEGKETIVIAEGFNGLNCWYLFASYHSLNKHNFISRYGMVCITINPSLKLAKGLCGCLVLSHSQHVKSHGLRQRSALTCT
jgi:hypothetical protein